MSLHRVASLESFSIVPSEERSRRSSDVSVRAQKLSFNPLPDEWDPPAARQDNVQSVGAFDVPRRKRILQITVTVIYCLFSSGIVFGYAAIKPVLKKEGAYRDVCDNNSLGDGVSEDTCVEIHLNLMFTVAAVATNVAALPVGAILDHYGPRVCGLLGALFLAGGSLLMAFERDLPFDGFLFGYLFLALGGPFTYISAFQLSNAFPRNSGLILALLTGAFDASSALFLIYRLMFEHTGGRFGHRKFFLHYLIVPAIVAVLQVVMLPKQSYKTIGELIQEADEPIPSPPARDQVDEHTALLAEEERQHRESVVADIEELLGSTALDKQVRKEERKNEISGVWGVMHNYTALQQIRSPWFILICLFTVVQMTRINYFVATIRAQYLALFPMFPSTAIEINNFFDLALPIGGILSIPSIGLILDHTSTLTVLATLVAVATAIGALGIIPALWAAYANVILFVLYRPFYYTAVSDYSAKVFGFRTFGTVYGTIICLSGLLNFSQSGLDYLFHQTFDGDPVPVNVLLMALGLGIGICLVMYVGIKAGGLRKDLARREAEHAFAIREQPAI